MIFFRKSYRVGASPRERLLTLACFLFLVGLVGWVVHRGGQVDPDLFRLDDASLREKGSGPTIYEREVVVHASRAVGQHPVAALLVERLPGLGFRRSGPVESYGYDELYVKINGRETLYKSFGFRNLWWASYEQGEESLDVEIFQHESPMAAFGVFSAERAGIEGALLEPTRTVIPNGLYFVAGTYYVRVLGASAAPLVKKAAETVQGMLSGLGEIGLEATASEESLPAPPPGVGSGKSRPPLEGEAPGAPGPGSGDLAGGGPDAPGTCPPGYDEACTNPRSLPPTLPRGGGDEEGGEPSGGAVARAAAESEGAALRALLLKPESWTPLANPLVSLGADPGTLEYHAEYGLGLEAFSGLFVASVPVGERTARLFLLPAGSEARAREAFDGYQEMLASNGNPQELDWGDTPPEERAASLVDMLDTIEAGFRRGPWVAGVTEAEDAEVAEDGLALLLGLLRPTR